MNPRTRKNEIELPPGYPATMGDILRHNPYSRYEDTKDHDEEPDEDDDSDETSDEDEWTEDDA